MENASYYPPKSVAERIKMHLDKFSGEGCYEWPLSKMKSGYGQLSTSHGSAKLRSAHYAHRASYAITYGPVPKGFFVCHKCDNRACFRPDHLFLGTAKDNNQDRADKGRSAEQKGRFSGDKHWTRKKPELKDSRLAGEKHYGTKLTNADAEEIRSSSLKGVELARLYGVSPASISKIKLGLTFRQSSLLANSDADSLK